MTAAHRGCISCHEESPLPALGAQRPGEGRRKAAFLFVHPPEPHFGQAGEYERSRRLAARRRVAARLPQAPRSRDHARGEWPARASSRRRSTSRRATTAAGTGRRAPPVPSWQFLLDSAVWQLRSEVSARSASASCSIRRQRSGSIDPLIAASICFHPSRRNDRETAAHARARVPVCLQTRDFARVQQRAATAPGLPTFSRQAAGHTAGLVSRRRPSLIVRCLVCRAGDHLFRDCALCQRNHRCDCPLAVRPPVMGGAGTM